MIYSLTNNRISVQINSLGAELISVVDANQGFEFMWQGNPEIWGRTSPVLFPIVGKVKDDKLKIGGDSYPLTQHGFARDCIFECNQNNSSSIHFRLANSTETLAKYPFAFILEISYEIIENRVICTWNVTNSGDTSIYFSIGAHPGFHIIGSNLSDYVLLFGEMEVLERLLLTNGLLNHTSKLLVSNENELPLNKALFEDDAIVLKHFNSQEITLKHRSLTHAVTVHCKDFPYMGIWSKKGTDAFLCIEPWFGIADTIEGHTDITKKEGMICLETRNTFKASYSMDFTI